MQFENLKLKSIECGIKMMPESNHWVAKNRKFHIIGVELGGISVHDFGFDKFITKRNSLFFYNQKDDYEVNIEEPGESLSVHFTTYEDIETDSFCIYDGATPEIIALLDRIINKCSVVGGNDLKLYELFYRFCNATETARKKNYSKKDMRMAEAKDYMDNHFRDDNCLEKAAEASGVTRRRFNDLFKKSVGTTPNRYIVRLRTDYAKQLLAATALSVSKISEMCGFADIYYFSKTFKKEIGQTPSDYRKSL